MTPTARVEAMEQLVALGDQLRAAMKRAGDERK
jgi:hypothetical protein